MNQAGTVACCAVCELPTYRRCSRCQLVYYCNTEHQQGDWRRHKTECLSKSTKPGRKHKSKSSSSSSSSGVRLEEPNQKVPSDNATVSNKREGDSDRTHCNATNSDIKSDGQISEEASTCTSKHNSVISSVVHAYQDTNVKSAITDEGSSEQEILTESAQQLSMVDFTAPGSSNTSPPTNHTDKPEMKMPLPEGKRREYPEGVLRPNIAPALSNTDNIEGQGLEICNRLIRDMSEYGVCVLDNFLGRDKGLLVLKEVLSMYRSGIFAPGQLVSAHRNAQTIRSDRITWIDGKEPQCKFIGQLISQVDSIVLKANKMANNDKMGEYNITGRTKAMVACYPGSGSHYVKHVDNPNKDGRCITAIYYLNLDWDVERNGGLLRVFPEGRNEVADIAPLFDRMLFFWSDRRNPHEVQPAFGTRYAITLWYFDAFEREVARSHFGERNGLCARRRSRRVFPYARAGAFGESASGRHPLAEFVRGPLQRAGRWTVHPAGCGEAVQRAQPAESSSK